MLYVSYISKRLGLGKRPKEKDCGDLVMESTFFWDIRVRKREMEKAATRNMTSKRTC